MIGIYDSGIGGLTVVKAITEIIPGYDIIYFGDTARTPYGNKSPETVIEYAVQNTTFLLNNGAKIIVMACNTASSVAFDIVEKRSRASKKIVRLCRFMDIPQVETCTVPIHKCISINIIIQ